MIKTFADKRTKLLFDTGKVNSLPQEILKRALRKLEYIHLAIAIEDLRVPPTGYMHCKTTEKAIIQSL